VKCAARGLLEMQDPKSRQKFAIWAPTLSGYVFASKARIDNWKKNSLNSKLLHMSSQYGELRPTSGWDLLASLRHPSTFQRVSRFGSVTARHSTSGRRPNFAACVEQRAPPIFGRSAITLGIGPHSSLLLLQTQMTISQTINHRLA